jgi:beta-glucanase (GH16 family)
MAMPRRGGAVLALAAVALGAVIAFGATAAIASRSVVVRKHVPSPGRYNVSIVVSGQSDAANRVAVKVGTARTYVVTTSPNRPTTVTAQVVVTGRVLTVRASGRSAPPRLKIELTKLETLPGGVALPASASGSIEPLEVAGTWHLIFDDDFAGSSLDPTWSTGWFGSGITGGIGGAPEPECYDPSHVVQANGELDINFTKQTESCDGASHPYTTGIVTTNGNFDFTYGYIEFRAWLPTTSDGQVADWPDLWTDGQHWPADGEIDVVEGLDGAACAHWHGPTDNGAGFGAGGGTGCPAATLTGGWHTFGADWEPGIVTWYYDGTDIGCVASSGTECGGVNSIVTSSPMYLILSLGSNPDYTITAPTSLRVAYVRVWQH